MAKTIQDVLEFSDSSVNQEIRGNTTSSYDEDDSGSILFQNQNYLNQLSELMDNIADKGAAVAQLRDGTVFVSETRIVVYKYVWDKNKCMFIKQRTRSARNNKVRVESDVMAEEEVE